MLKVHAAEPSAILHRVATDQFETGLVIAAGADIQGGVAPIGAIFGEDPIESAGLGDVCCVSLL